MNVEIITIGDELLIGQVIDTNSAWMGKQLNARGFSIQRITTISDEPDAIIDALDRALKSANIVLISGGIGPTKDDLTKQTLAQYFNSPLVYNEACSQNIIGLFKNRNIKINALTEKQAWIPACCEPIINTMGTAPIMWFEQDGKIIVSMPGVPFEMKEAMNAEIIPRLSHRYKLTPVMHLTLWVANIAESIMALQLEDFENNLPSEAQLAYLPVPGLVRLRVSVRSNDFKYSQQIIEDAKSTLTKLFKEKIIGEGEQGPAEYLGRKIASLGWTLGTAESCTGGTLAQEITSIAGCSAYYRGSIVAYSNELKHKLLGISLLDLEQHGAVSQQVVEAMAKGAQKELGCDIALATSGIAGPDGGTNEKPVGTIWIAVATPTKCISQCLHLGSTRHLNISRTCTHVWGLVNSLL